MLRYYQKSLKELEESTDKQQATGELEELHNQQAVNGQASVNNRKRKKYDERESSHEREKKRNKELRKKEKRKKTMEDFTTIEAATKHDHGNVSEVRKKAKEKKRRHLEIDVEAVNSSHGESCATQFDKSTVIDLTIVSSDNEVRKKAKKKKRRHLETDVEAVNSIDRESCATQFDKSRVIDSSVVSSDNKVRKKAKKKKKRHLEIDVEATNSSHGGSCATQFDKSRVIDSSVVSSNSEFRKKAKKKKKKRHLETDVEAVNSSHRESCATQFDKLKVIDSSNILSNKEIKKKRKRKSLTEFSEGAVKKSKQSVQTSKSQKRRDREKCVEMLESSFSCNQRTENVHTSAESSTFEQTRHSFEISPGSSPQSNTHLSKKSSLSGKEHVSTEEDQQQKKGKKKTDNLMTNKAVDKNNLANGNDNETEVIKSRVEPAMVSNIKMDEAKLREATASSNIIHETWTLPEKRLNALAEKGIKVKKGKWSSQELDLLKFNMARFLERHNLADPNPLLFRSSMDKEESKYWKRFARSNDFCKELGKGIQRELFSIYKCATRIFDETNYVGRYTEDEIKELKRLHAIHGSDWVTIGQLMDRSRMSVNRKISKLPPTCKGDKPEQKGKWTDDEVKRLKEAVHFVTNTTDGQPVFHSIDWQGVAQMVKTRGAEMCRKKWLNGLCWSNTENKTETKWTKNHELKLITKLYNSGATEECDVDWADVKSEYEIDYSPQWLRQKWSQIKKNVPNYQRLSFEDIVDYLYQVYGQTLRDKLQAGASSNETE